MNFTNNETDWIAADSDSNTATAVAEPESTAPARDRCARTPHSRAELERCLELVRIIVNKMKVNVPYQCDEEEMISLGNSGLVQAIHQYDDSKGASFETYASIRIRGAILDGLRRMDTMPRQSRRQFRQLQQSIQDFEQQHGRSPSEKELQQATQMSAAQIDRIRQSGLASQRISLDSTLDESRKDLAETIPDTGQPAAFDVVEDKEIRSLIKERMKRLPRREQKILALYYHENASFAEIAAAIGLCESRVCQLHAQCIRKLREFVQSVSHSPAY